MDADLERGTEIPRKVIQQVAEKVYRMLVRDLQIESERRGMLADRPSRRGDHKCSF